MAVVPVVPGWANGELGHVEAADIDTAGVQQALQRRAIRVGDVFATDLRAAGGRLALAIEHVLVGERHAVQRPESLAFGQRGIRALRGLQRLIGLDPDVAIDDRLHPRDALDARLGDFDGGDLALADLAGDVDQVEIQEITAHDREPFVSASKLKANSAGSDSMGCSFDVFVAVLES